MDSSSELEVLNGLIDEVEQDEGMSESKYTHAVQVLTPIELLQQVDRLVEANRGLTRPIVFRRALRAYLKVLAKTGQLDLRPKVKRRTV
ncbi:MAG: hypothetical protein ACOYXN_08870 [Acidobacteriota bacterium]|jgi:hypothetical protein